LEVIAADFGQAAQEVFDPSSGFNQSNLDAVLLVLEYRAYSFLVNEPGYSGKNNPGLEAFDYLEQIRQFFAFNGKTICILQTLACPPYDLSGNFDAHS
jgi:predicted enzyme involved in methoxymalonyl-ACP biosynthesis